MNHVNLPTVADVAAAAGGAPDGAPSDALLTNHQLATPSVVSLSVTANSLPRSANMNGIAVSQNR